MRSNLSGKAHRGKTGSNWSAHVWQITLDRGGTRNKTPLVVFNLGQQPLSTSLGNIHAVFQCVVLNDSRLHPVDSLFPSHVNREVEWRYSGKGDQTTLIRNAWVKLFCPWIATELFINYELRVLHKDYRPLLCLVLLSFSYGMSNRKAYQHG